MSQTRILSFEGQILSTLEMAGKDEVCNFAKDMADAGCNILARLEGSRAAADFTYALGDRITAPILGAPTNVIPFPTPEQPTENLARPVVRWSAFLVAYLMGTAWGGILGFLAGRAG